MSPGGLTYLDTLESVLDLVDSALGGECVHTTIVVLFTVRTRRLVSRVKGREKEYH